MIVKPTHCKICNKELTVSETVDFYGGEPTIFTFQCKDKHYYLTICYGSFFYERYTDIGGIDHYTNPNDTEASNKIFEKVRQQYQNLKAFV
jgi:hypothetical protein